MAEITKPTPSSPQKQSTKESPLVEVTKTYYARPEDLFKALSTEESVREWWGPEEFFCPYAKIDFKVGGKYLFAMQEKKDASKPVYSTGIYQEIVPNRRIVYSDDFAYASGEVATPKEAGAGDSFPDMGTTYVTIELKPVGDKQTELSLSHKGIPANMHDDCVQGWGSCLDKIKPIVEKH